MRDIRIAVAGLTLPFRFDSERLKSDLGLIAADEWVPHYNENDYGGQWSGVALRSLNGTGRNLTAGPPGAAEFTDTPVLERCAYFLEVLRAFPCPLKSARLLNLAPGSFIREHSDQALGFEEGEVRIHVPIRTNPGVEFYVCGDRLQMDPGGCYYVNVNLPHRVNNRGTEGRVHLVIDAMVDDWVRELFTACPPIARSSVPPGGFGEFSALVFSDEALRTRLQAVPDRTALQRAVAEDAAARGLDLNEGDVAAAYKAVPASAPGNTDGWLPVKVSVRDGDENPSASWIHVAGRRFTEPFFDAEVRTCLRDPFTALFRREMPLLEGRRVRPDGFIFHISRCGSTLVSRSLAAAESTMVLSEPSPLDDIVRTGRGDWLERLVSAFGRSGAGGRIVIKLDSWHVRSLPLFRAVFPDVPWVFVYRDPLEVLVSQLRSGGMHCLPGAMDPAALGMRFEDIVTLSKQEWCERVLSGYFQAAMEFRADPKGLFIDYRELPGAITGAIAAHFGLGLSAEDAARVEAATRINAKSPSEVFADDRAEKRRLAEGLVRGPGLDALMALYRELGNPELGNPKNY